MSLSPLVPSKRNSEREQSMNKDKVKGWNYLLRATYLLPFTITLLPLPGAYGARPITSLPGIVDAPPPASAAAPSAPSRALPGLSEQDNEVYQQIRLLNQVSEDQLSDHSDPGLGILRTMAEKGGPDYLNSVKRLLGRAEIRGPLKPGTKSILAGLLSERWDAFNLSGNLWLAALQSSNSDHRLRARQRLIGFIQPVHLPVLIGILKIPGPNVLAYEILQEITGQTLDPSVPSWKAWWQRTGGKVDLIGHILDGSETHISGYTVKPLDPQLFWYLPETVRQAAMPYAKRSSKEQLEISRWNETAGREVKAYIDDWSGLKPWFDRIIHHADPRVSAYLESLIKDPGLGDYASMVLAWRGSKASLGAIQNADAQSPSAGRAMARGVLGDKAALSDLLAMIDHNPQPFSFAIMDQTVHGFVDILHSAGMLPAEQAFEALTHQSFGFTEANTRSEKKKALRAARRWLAKNGEVLVYDAHGYFVLPSEK